jgi:hypothetical protein
MLNHGSTLMKRITRKTTKAGTQIAPRQTRVHPSFYLCLSLLSLCSLLTPAHAAPKRDRPAPENVEWIWQYTPDDTHHDGRENDLVEDTRFVPFLQQFLTTPQTFWGFPLNGRYRSLANTALDHLTVPGKVLTENNRYITITGCTVHFCPARGLLWLDLGGEHDRNDMHHLVVFAALDWSKQGLPTTDPAAEYTLWLFPDEALSLDSPATHPPAALVKSVARWAAEPLAGSGIVQNITHAMIVDPDGTPHEVAPSALGIEPPHPPATTGDSATVLKPRN